MRHALLPALYSKSGDIEHEMEEAVDDIVEVFDGAG
jgi:hypothetical protein